MGFPSAHADFLVNTISQLPSEFLLTRCGYCRCHDPTPVINAACRSAIAAIPSDGGTPGAAG